MVLRAIVAAAAVATTCAYYQPTGTTWDKNTTERLSEEFFRQCPNSSVIEFNEGRVMRIHGDLPSRSITSRAVIVERSAGAVYADHLKLHNGGAITISTKRMTPSEAHAGHLRSHGGGRMIYMKGQANVKGAVFFDKSKHVATYKTGASFIELARPNANRYTGWHHVAETSSEMKLDNPDEHGWEIVSEKKEVLTTSSCDETHRFVGGPCQLGGNTIRRTFHIHERHTQLHLSSLIHFFGNWTDETVWAKVDGDYVWTSSHHQQEHPVKPFALGDCGISDLGNEIDVYVPHSSPTVTIELGSLSTRVSCSQSWALGHTLVEVQ